MSALDDAVRRYLMALARADGEDPLACPRELAEAALSQQTDGAPLDTTVARAMREHFTVLAAVALYRHLAGGVVDPRDVADRKIGAALDAVYGVAADSLGRLQAAVTSAPRLRAVRAS